jgi:hypothetical protein
MRRSVQAINELDLLERCLVPAHRTCTFEITVCDLKSRRADVAVKVGLTRITECATNDGGLSAMGNKQGVKRTLTAPASTRPVSGEVLQSKRPRTTTCDGSGVTTASVAALSSVTWFCRASRTACRKGGRSDSSRFKSSAKTPAPHVHPATAPFTRSDQATHAHGVTNNSRQATTEAPCRGSCPESR